MMRRDLPIRLLVVEDDTESAEELAELLESHGFVTRIAATVPQARAAVAQFSPEFALVDLQLGTSSGAKLAAELQACPPPLVVLLSGRQLTSAEVGMFGTNAPPRLLAKPLDVQALVDLALALRP